MLDRKILAKIQIAKKELMMDDDAYRAMLKNIAGVTSSKDLSVKQAEAVLGHMQSCGFVPKASPKHGKKPAKPAAGKAALMRKIEALLAERGYPWEYLTSTGRTSQSMVQRICKVDALEFATAEGLGKLVAALSYDLQRNGRKAASNQQRKAS
ncbi:gp16 family protein [Chitinibacter sp. S2-10]|uniref:gp16 family protein n=1 Tax=Chitinibacter sp. S2-10 TaxID=3373597 RepID=UPI0039778211